jgi:hypothetical protein
LKTVAVHRIEGASLRDVLLLRIAWWLDMYLPLMMANMLAETRLVYDQ